MATGQKHGVATAQREAEEREVLQLKPFDEGVQIAAVSRRRIVAVRSPATVAMSPLVDGDNPIVMPHRRREVGPGVRCLSYPMEEQQGCFARVAPLKIAQSNFRRLQKSLAPRRNRRRRWLQ